VRGCNQQAAGHIATLLVLVVSGGAAPSGQPGGAGVRHHSMMFVCDDCMHASPGPAVPQSAESVWGSILKGFHFCRPLLQLLGRAGAVLLQVQIQS
jgi:hypothetical protein